MSRRIERVNSLIRETIGQVLLSKLSDPRIDPVRTTVTRVEVPEDLLTARVYVSIIGTEPEQRTVLRALQHAAGRIQAEMMQRVRLRHTPVLDFVLDTKYKKTIETLKIIEQVADEIRRKDEALQTRVGTDPTGEPQET